MKSATSYKTGFTLLELVIVVSIMALIAGILLSGLQNYASYQRYNQASADVEFILNQARLNAKIASGDTSHGIKFSGGDMILFEGDVYSAVDPANELVSYSLVNIAATLTAGIDEIVFSKLSGIPSATGTIVVSGTSFNASTTFTVSDAGVIQ